MSDRIASDPDRRRRARTVHRQESDPDDGPAQSRADWCLLLQGPVLKHGVGMAIGGSSDARPAVLSALAILYPSCQEISESVTPHVPVSTANLVPINTA